MIRRAFPSRLLFTRDSFYSWEIQNFSQAKFSYENANYFNLASILRSFKKYRDKRIFIFLWTEQIECHDSFKIADPFTDFQLAWNRIASLSFSLSLSLSLSISLQNKIRENLVYDVCTQKRLKKMFYYPAYTMLLHVDGYFFLSYDSFFPRVLATHKAFDRSGKK